MSTLIALSLASLLIDTASTKRRSPFLILLVAITVFNFGENLCRNRTLSLRLHK